MAQLTLANVLDFVQDEIPQRPVEKVTRALNLTLLELANELPMIQRSTFTTRAQITSATATVTAGATGVSFSASILSASDPLMMVQVAGDSTWYSMTYASASAGVLSSAFAGASGSGLSCTVAFPSVTFGTDVGEVLRMWRQGFIEIKPSLDQYRPSLVAWNDTGPPQFWSPYKFDGSATPDDSLRILLEPAPDAAYSVMFSYRTRIAFLTVGGSTSQKVACPDVYDSAVVSGTMWRCWDQEDGNGRANVWEARYARDKNRIRASRQAQADQMEDGFNGGLYVYEQHPVS